MPGRFTGTIDVLCDVDVAGYVAWLNEVPAEEWRGDLAWRNWDEMFRPFAESLIAEQYRDCGVAGTGLWIVEPGQVHPAHIDIQPDCWLVRIHVPLVTNEGCTVTMEDGERHLEVGKAYRFNTLASHAIANMGKTRRVHFMFDVVI